MVKICENPECRRPFRPKQRPETSKYCTRQCGHDARPRAARVTAGRKGGQISGERKRRQAEQRRAVPLANVRQQSYRLGFSAGYDKGYEDAVQRLWKVSA